MPQSVARQHHHFIFSTKSRAPVLQDAFRDELHRYMGSILKKKGCHPVLINSVTGHIHILCDLSRTLSSSAAIEELKTTSSKWLKKQGADLAQFSWQAGYGSFVVSLSHVPALMKYIERQPEHHRKKSFQDE